MAMPADALDASDLKNVLSGGLVREDVLDEIYDNSDIPTEFLDRIGSDSFTNPYAEWTQDKLAAPDITNAVISGSEFNTANNNANVTNARRLGNHAQISDKEVVVSERGNAVDSVGRSDEMGYQTARKIIELRRDQEAICLGNQASVQDNGNNTAGRSAGIGSWLTSFTQRGTDGANGGFNTTTKVVDAMTPGDTRAGTWEMIANGIEGVYLEGGNPGLLMSIPQITKRIGRYLFSTPYAAAPTANVNGSGGGVNQTSQGYIDTFKTDFGTLMEIVPNRLMQTYASNDAVPVQVGAVFGLDTRYWRKSSLYGVKVDALGKTGLNHKKLVHEDWMLKCLLERANFGIFDITPTAAWTAT